jgi:hypothetical protein
MCAALPTITPGLALGAAILSKAYLLSLIPGRNLAVGHRSSGRYRFL